MPLDFFARQLGADRKSSADSPIEVEETQRESVESLGSAKTTRIPQPLLYRIAKLLILTSAVLFLLSYPFQLSTFKDSFQHAYRRFTAVKISGQEQKEWCTFAIMCGTGDTDTVSEMRPLLVSAILLSTCRLHFIFLTDEDGAGRVHEMFAKNLTTADKPIRVDIMVISTEWIDEKALKIKLDPHGHHSGSWGTGKLLLPWILQDLDRVIVIDSDMIFLDDPASLWAQFDDDGTWAYKMPLFDRSKSSNICSCVVLMDIQKIRQVRAYPDLFSSVLHSHPEWRNETSLNYVPPHGDQGVYFGLMKSHPKLVNSLDDRFNVDHCHGYYGALRNSSSKMVSILHKNCESRRHALDAAGNLFFDFYSAYKWQWLKGLEDTGYPVTVNMISHETSRNSSTV
ncbi:unnamed protein product [Chondrus crispus]|uniref:Glycosyltransferase family 8 protein n=1 Tax=Chondrus crispus TaxID=2769 RepID=R7QB86_CHOCR|nr:unnamed protein product [Chondrus crispus]CDF34686.1 unnamed protein product [Chondrus crispus]|eukprot:XP_005714505.1 unnamed protein product [Chondrus crispus]